jgi:YidC/Oxa1 family membrane protein insertase
MLHQIWDTLLYEPLINALAFLVSIVPGGDVGVAVVILTVLVKVLLFPLSQASIKSQAIMTNLAPELEKIKKSGVSKEEQARLTFELYKTHKTNPFSGCFLVLIQLPIIFALYYVFFKGIDFNIDIMYSFIKIPEHINMLFLGIIDIGKKSLFLAVLAGISQFLQAYYMPKPSAVATDVSDTSFQANFSKSMNTQMKYVFPFIVTFFAYSISGAIALYWFTSNMFTVGQQIYVERKKK